MYNRAMTVIPVDKMDLLGHVKLDMRISPKIGRELKIDIYESVEKVAKASIQVTLPDRLHLTQEQFGSIMEDTLEMEGTTDRLYLTPFNVMEIIIDREYKTVQAIEEHMQDVDDLKLVNYNEEQPDDR